MPNLGDLLSALGGGDGEHMGDLLELLALLGGDSPGGDMGKRSEMNRLRNEGIDHYNRSENDAALSCWRKAYRLAEELGDEEMRAKLKNDEGDALNQMFRLRDALTCFMELETMEGNPIERWNGMTTQLDIAARIPISLEKIRGILFRCQAEMERQGLQASRSMLLDAESTLASYRHDYTTAIAKEQEAIAAYDPEAYPRYRIITHYAQMIDAYLDAGDLDAAKRWMDRLEDARTEDEVLKEQMVFVRRMRLALKEGDNGAALDYAMKTRVREGVIEAALAAGLPRLVRIPMARRLYNNLHIEDAHIKYETLRQAGDYHRLTAKEAEPGSADAARHTAMARRYYRYADNVGRLIDERLECTWHGEETRQRFRMLEE